MEKKKAVENVDSTNAIDKTACSKALKNVKTAIENLEEAVEIFTREAGLELCVGIRDSKYTEFHVYKGISNLDCIAEEVSLEDDKSGDYPFKKTVKIGDFEFFQLEHTNNFETETE